MNARLDLVGSWCSRFELDLGTDGVEGDRDVVFSVVYVQRRGCERVILVRGAMISHLIGIDERMVKLRTEVKALMDDQNKCLM